MTGGGYVETLPRCINCGGTAVHQPCDDHWYSENERLMAVVEELSERVGALERGRPSPVYDGTPFRKERKTKERRKGGTPGL